jgi:hypothetical protein
MRPPITIVMTTWMPEGPVGESRRSSARAALTSWRLHLDYEGELRLHIADDGSPVEDLIKSVGARYDGFWPTTTSRQQRRGVGASLNAGLKASWGNSPLAAYFVDDWGLAAPFDLTPWAELLAEDETVGMVRLGPPHPWIEGQVEHHLEGWWMRLKRGFYAFAHRPALYHQRFFDAYGYFEEGVNAFECEQIYSERFNRSQGPDIVYALPYPWVHLGVTEVGGVVPEGVAAV